MYLPDTAERFVVCLLDPLYTYSSLDIRRFLILLQEILSVLAGDP